MEKRENVLISACLLGLHCRYDGRCQDIPEFEKNLPALMQQYQLIPFCPEIYGGLETPRKPSEIKGDKVYNCIGVDVTKQFAKGAAEALRISKLFQCEKAILKRRSPSCGNGEIYDGTFSKTLKEGDGMTARLLKEHGIVILDEDTARELL